MAIGGQNYTDELGRVFWMDNQSEGLELPQEAEMRLRAQQLTIDDVLKMLEKYRFSARQLIALGLAGAHLSNAWIAEMALQESLDIEPENGDVYGHLISFYAAIQQWDSCHAVWEKGLLHATEKAFLRYHYGRALYMQERYPEAVAEAQAALTEWEFNHLDSILLCLHSNLGVLVSAQEPQRQELFRQAKQLWQGALSRFPDSDELQKLHHILSKESFEDA